MNLENKTKENLHQYILKKLNLTQELDE